ncbi:putative ribonuclease H-like domain-containing protein [Tanacetum coccineum]
MQEELLQFKLQKVWILVDLPKGKRAIGTKWIFRNKKDERGIMIRKKARLVAHGYTQEEGIDYDEVFATVERIEAIRLFLAYASFIGFMLYQMDVKSAFLYRTIEEEVYVDDIIFGFTNKELCTRFEELMKDKFQMSSIGELTFFLGLQVQQKEDGLFISQHKYVAEILKKFNYTNVKSASTLVDLEKPLVKDGDANDVDVHLYRSMNGYLMYLTVSRPDIMFAVCAYARFQVTPKTSHLLAVKRIFRYLNGKPTLGLWYSRDSPFELVAYTDSDYARATQDRKSTSGGSRYVAAASCCGQVLWIQNQLLDYGYNFINTVINIDNNSTICIIEILVQHSKTKHIEIRHHFIRDCNAKKLIQIVKIHTDHNVADLLTKGFDAGRFQYLVSRIKTRLGISKEVGTPRYLSLVVPLTKVGDEAVHKELGDRMERAATTASSLEAEQDSGSGPRCQDTILGDVNAQTRFEITSKQSIDPPLSRGYTLGSGEDSMKLIGIDEIFPKFAETHNVTVFLEKPKESDGFVEIIDFLKASSVSYALTVNPVIYTSCIEQFWATAKVQTVNGVRQLQALVDKKRVTVTESSIRRDLHLDDAEGIDCLPTATIFEELARMGYEKPSQKLTFYKAFFSPQWKYFIHTITQCLSAKSTAWNEFSSSMASLIICLATNQKFNLSKYIFDAMVKHLDGGVKFLMYPRFLQVFINQQLEEDLEVRKEENVKTYRFEKTQQKCMSRRVESSEDQESLGAPEDASKQGRSIEDIDADVDDDVMHVEAKVDGKDEQSKKLDDSTAGEAIKAAKPKVVTTAATTATTIRPKDRWVVVQEPSEFRVPQETKPSSSKDKGKGIMIEPEFPLKRKDQIALDEQIARDIQAELDAELLEEQKLARKQEEEAN